MLLLHVAQRTFLSTCILFNSMPNWPEFIYCTLSFPQIEVMFIFSNVDASDGPSKFTKLAVLSAVH